MTVPMLYLQGVPFTKVQVYYSTNLRSLSMEEDICIEHILI